jgi:hypothetical protein
LAYIPETVMNCDDDYVNKPEKYKCLGNTIDENISQESSLDVFCHVIFDVNIDVMDVRGRPQEFVAL